LNGYNFTDRVRKVLQMAREEAARLHHEYVGTEHILLAILREGERVAAAALTNLNVDFEEVTAAVNDTVKEGKYDATGPDLPYTSRAKKILEFSMSEARELNHSYVGTEHLMAIALVELHRVRGGTYPDSLDDLQFLGAYDRAALVKGLRYEKLPDGYALDVVTPKGEKAALRYPTDFWRGLGIRRTNVDRSSP